MNKVRFMYDHPLKNMDMFYATRFFGHDPMVFFEFRGKKYLVADTLEVDRAKKEASVDKVLLSSDLKKDVELRKGNSRDIVDALNLIFKKWKVKILEVPANFPLALADKFREKKYKLTIGQSPFYPKRTQKTPSEKRDMVASQKVTFKLIGLVENVLRQSKIKGDILTYKGKTLTSEFVKELVQIETIKLGFEMKEGLIVACGDHSIDPHHSGSGVIRPHMAIVVDIFPSSQKTLYWGDATRTFCRGNAPTTLKKMYETVKQAQETAIKSIRAGVNGKNIHQGIVSFFESRGYKTGEMKGRQQGFIHPTGHGIGLEIHENPPVLGMKDCILKAGNVTSVEPGLYYKDIGGVRIEDLVYVTKTGCEVLGYYPKQLEIL